MAAQAKTGCRYLLTLFSWASESLRTYLVWKRRGGGRQGGPLMQTHKDVRERGSSLSIPSEALGCPPGGFAHLGSHVWPNLRTAWKCLVWDGWGAGQSRGLWPAGGSGQQGQVSRKGHVGTHMSRVFGSPQCPSVLLRRAGRDRNVFPWLRRGPTTLPSIFQSLSSP